MNFPLTQFQQLDTPFYYYDLGLLKTTLQNIRHLLAGRNAYHVHYAIKANANPRLLQIISAAGLGADCVSGGEIEAAVKNGFAPSSIVFAGVGKTDKEIRLALEAGIHSFNVESLPELEAINEQAVAMGKQAKVAFRINPNVDAHTHAKITTGLNENKFGIAWEDTLAAIRRANELPGVHYVGLHFHIGSQITDMEPFRALCLKVNELQNMLEAEGIRTESINVGGGLGIDYGQPDAHPVPDFEKYFAVFENHLQLRPHQQLHFELGRSIVAQCGTLIARTLYVKQGHTKQFVIVDAGFTDLIRPAMYGSHHFTQNISAPHGAPCETYDIVGPICESSDVFSKDEVLPVTHRGDLIAFRSAGAYGEVMASQYNLRPLAPAYFSK